MIELKFSADFSKSVKFLKDMKTAIRKAEISAMSKAADQGKNYSSRKIRETYNIKAKDLNQNLKSHKATSAYPKSKIIAYGKKRLPLVLFNARQNKQGVSVEIIKGQRRLLPHRFIATMPAGHRGVFERYGNKRVMDSGRYVNQYKQPIRELKTLRVSSMFSAQRVRPHIIKFIDQKLPVIFNAQLKYYKSRIK